MKDYKECSDAEFKNAMAKKDADVETLTNQELYILKTKFYADAAQCRNGSSSYAMGLSISSSNRAKRYDDELRARMLDGKEQKI